MKEKLDIARQLAKLGVDVIEAGFPVASPGDFEAVRNIALETGTAVDAAGYVPVICGLSRCGVRCAARSSIAAVWLRLARLPASPPRACRRPVAASPPVSHSHSAAPQGPGDCLGSGAGGQAAACALLPGDLADSHAVQAAHDARSGVHAPCRQGPAPGAKLAVLLMGQPQPPALPMHG